MPRRASSQLGYEIYASDRTKAGLASVNRGFSSMASGISREAGMASQAISGAIMGNASFAAAGAGAALLTFAASAIQAFAEVELKWIQVSNLMRNESQATKDAILADLEAISTRIGEPMTLVIDTAFQARSAGATPESIARITEMSHIAGLGAIGDPATIAKLLQGTVNVFDRTELEAMNIWLATAGRGVTTMGELAQYMGDVNQMAGQLGVSLENVGSATAALTAENLKTSTSATQLLGLMRELSKEGSKGAEFFKQASGGESFVEYMRRTEDFAGAMKLLADEGERQGVVWTNVFSESQAALGAATLATDEYYNAHKEFLTEIPGAYQEVADSVTDSTQVAINRQKQIMEQSKREFAEQLKDLARNAEDSWAELQTGQTKAFREALIGSELYLTKYNTSRSDALDKYQDKLRASLINERNTWAAHYTAIAQMDWQVAQQRIANLQLRSRATPQVVNPAMQWATGGVTPPPQIDFDYTYGTQLDPNFGLDGGGAGGGKLDRIDRNITGLRNDLKTGQAITVTLDAMVDEGVILRTDTVERASQQIAARFGNHPVNRTRSG